MDGYEIHRDVHGYIDAIEKDEVVVLHLVSGSKRNEKSAEKFVDEINAMREVVVSLAEYSADNFAALGPLGFKILVNEAQRVLGKYGDLSVDILEGER